MADPKVGSAHAHALCDVLRCAHIETELGGISHPNQFFEQSSKFYVEKEQKEQGTVATAVQEAKKQRVDEPTAMAVDAAA